MSLLAGASNYQLQVAGVCTAGVRSILTQGTGTWTFAAGIVQSGASSVVNQGGLITANGITLSSGIWNGNAHEIDDSGSFDSTGATFTPGNSILKMTGTSKTLKTAASLYDLTIDTGASISLTASVTVTHILTWAGTFAPATYTLDNTGGTCSVTNDFAISTAATFIAGTALSVGGNFDSSAITFTQGTSLVTLSGSGKTIKIGGSQTFYSLTVSGSDTLLSNIYVSHSLTVSGSVAGKYAFILTGTSSTIDIAVGQWLYTLTVNGGATYTLNSDVYCWHSYSNSGTVNLNGYSVFYPYKLNNYWYNSTIWHNQTYWTNTTLWNNQTIWNNQTYWSNSTYWNNQTIWANQTLWSNSTLWNNQTIWSNQTINFWHNGTINQTLWFNSTYWSNISMSADFSYYGSDGLIHFTDETIPGSDLVNWSWSFGDGKASFAQNPSHQYDTSGSYSVTLVTTDINGTQRFVTRNIVISIHFDLITAILQFLNSVSFLGVSIAATGLMGFMVAHPKHRGSALAMILIGAVIFIFSLIR